MPDQNILIVGGNGLIGTYLLKKLQNDYNTYAISHTKNLKIRYFFQLDLTDYNKVREFAKNSKFYDVIIFLTGLAHSKGKGKDFTEFKKINFITTLIDIPLPKNLSIFFKIKLDNNTIIITMREPKKGLASSFKIYLYKIFIN